MRFAQGFERYSVSDVFEQAIGSRGRAELIDVADICPFKVQLISSHDADLLVYQFGSGVPFEVRRVFTIHAHEAVERGRHAHKQCGQVMVCLAGRCTITLDDGANRKIVELSRPQEALYVPPSIWAAQRYEEQGTILMVMCDQLYDESDYIRNYEAFVAYRKGKA